jgi:hypothetical protein
MKAPQDQQQKRCDQSCERGPPKAEPHRAGIRQSRLGDGPSTAKEQNGEKQQM